MTLELAKLGVHELVDEAAKLTVIIDLNVGHVLTYRFHLKEEDKYDELINFTFLIFV